MLVCAPEQVARLSKLKKADLASEAERLVAGTGWLPAKLCTAAVEVESATGAPRHEATGDAASGSDEDR